MIYFMNVLYIFLFNVTVPFEVLSIRFTSVTSKHWSHIHKLYLEEGNEDPPSESDAVATDVFTQAQICEDIGNSMPLRYYGRPENIIHLQVELRKPEYSSILNLSTESPYGYVNRGFKVTANSSGHMFSLPKREYVLVCWLRENSTHELTPFFVSKVYKELLGFHSHRFVFPTRKDRMSNQNEMEYRNTDQLWYRQIFLAEGPARDHRVPDFNIELHYLELRKHYNPVENRILDPICKLNLSGDLNNEDFRLCSRVFNSTYFKTEVDSILEMFGNRCYQGNIAFRTEEGLQEAENEPYYELMISCEAILITKQLKNFYISRAYNPNQVFVSSFSPDPSGQLKLYLENLSIDVGIVSEPYNFGDVEI